MDSFTNKTVLITGGTGSFGNAMLERLLKTDVAQIRIFSRDEKKQDDMRHGLQAAYPDVADKLRYYIGDVRDASSVRDAMSGVDYVFHAAALKQVPSCEFFPMEAVRTNVYGTQNVLNAAVAAGVSCVVCLSTDKAVYPVNAMGMSKAMMERVAVAQSRHSGNTRICCTRYGNVLCSRGSVVPLWVEQIRTGKPISVTEPNMTRFVMTLEEAVELALYAFTHGCNGDIWVRKAPACTIGTLAAAVTDIFAPEHPICTIGIRHGEKLFETLLTNEECAAAVDMGTYYRIPCDERNLNYDKYYHTGNPGRNPLTEYNSGNTNRLSVEQIRELLLQQPYIREELMR